MASLHNILRRVEVAARSSGRQADFPRDDLEILSSELGLASISTPEGALGLMRSTIDALVADYERFDSPTRMSRCWVQLVNRVATPFAGGFKTRSDAFAAELSSIAAVLEVVQDARFSSDVQASMAAAIVWQWIDEVDNLLDISTLNRTFSELMVLYTYRYRFASVPLLEHLSGHVDALSHPIKAAFSCFAYQMIGDSPNAIASLRSVEVSEGALPLSAAKLIGYSLTVASLTDPTTVAQPGLFSADVDVREPFRIAIRVWEAHGADENLYRAKASFGAVCEDPAVVNDAINSAIDVLRSYADTAPTQFVELMQYRSDLMARLEVLKELKGVAAIRADAEAALSAARETATQVPTVVGLFTAVIALVVGSSQVAQGLDVRGRIMVVASLGVILLGFVVALAGVTQFVSRAATGVRWMAVFLLAVVLSAVFLLAVIYQFSGS